VEPKAPTLGGLLKRIFKNIFNSGAVYLLTIKPTILFESAISSEVVSSEATVFKLALNKLAIRKKTSSEFAATKFDVAEDRLAKMPPIPVAL
jgi:hypothetical protein